MTETSSMTSANEIGYHVGFGGGIHARVYPADAVALQFGATFVQRGATLTPPDSSQTLGSRGSITLNYVCLDVLVNWLVLRRDRSSLRLFAGPYMDVFVSGESLTEVTTPFGNFSLSDTLTTKEVRSLGFGIAFGAGVDFNVGTGVLALDARYDLGLSLVPAENTTTDEVYSRGFQFQFSYLFRL